MAGAIVCSIKKAILSLWNTETLPASTVPTWLSSVAMLSGIFLKS
jgi:hypothetical protein